MAKREKLLEKARNSPAGWHKRDLDSLYRKWGFEIEERARHTMYTHPKYPDLYAVITRSSGEVSSRYVETAVELIDTLILRG